MIMCAPFLDHVVSARKNSKKVTPERTVQNRSPINDDPCHIHQLTLPGINAERALDHAESLALMINSKTTQARPEPSPFTPSCGHHPATQLAQLDININNERRRKAIVQPDIFWAREKQEFSEQSQTADIHRLTVKRPCRLRTKCRPNALTLF
jgi:hypothetical protein